MVTRRMVVAALLCAVSGMAAAQTDFPNRPVRIVVPVPPGSMLDTIPRLISEKLSARWRQPVVVENRPGFSQHIGAETVAKSKPDGYTLLFTPPGPLVVSPHLYPKLGFDPAELVPVTVAIRFSFVLVAGPKAPASTLTALIAYAKSNPGKVSYASPGNGSMPQLAMEKLARDAGIRLVHVPYQGVSPAQRDVLSGHVDVMFDPIGNSLPHIKDGKLRPLAVTAEQRHPELPDVPAAAELVHGYAHAGWFAVMAPPETPPALVARLSQDIVAALRLPDVADRLRVYTVTTVGTSPAEAASLIARERDQWRQVIAAAGIKAN